MRAFSMVEKQENGTRDCREIIMSENTADYFYRFEGDLAAAERRFRPECINGINPRYAVLYFGLSEIEQQSYRQYRYYYPAIPRCFGLLDRSSMEASGVNRIHRQPYLDLLGQGTLIGFVDTGIDYTNPLFQYADRTSRIVSIWDQTLQSGTPPYDLQYGSEYTREDLNAALRSENPRSVVPTTDEIGHGTFMAGIAAGNNDIPNDFTGVAPLAEIVMVKLKPAKKYLRDYYFINENAICYQENDIALGVRYLLEISRRERKPIIICLGVGTNMGGHDGSGVLDQFLDSYADTNRVCIVTATGNEAGYRTHYRKNGGQLAVSNDVELRVGEGDRGFSMEFWGGELQQYTLAIISPSGEISDLIGQRGTGNNLIRFLFDRTTVYADSIDTGILTGDQLIILRFQTPAAGIWTLRISPRRNVDGYFDLWLPLHDFAWGETYFLEPDPNITITDPGNTTLPITTAGYDHVTQAIYIHSGRGYTRTGTVKPNLAAPAVNVQGPAPGGGFVRQTGTSIAAAHTAGAAALLMQWGAVEGNQPGMSTSNIRVLLSRGAQKDGREYPNPEWGYGTLDVYNAFEQLRNRVFDTTTGT